MSTPPTMPPLRRRAIPGLTPTPAESQSAPGPRRAAATGSSVVSTDARVTAPSAPDPAQTNRVVTPAGEVAAANPAATQSLAAGARRRSEDYSATRLVNFRPPVDLHDRYRRLLVEVEQRHPRIRRPSLTDVIIALLEEGPGDSTELSELIRRKRADEYSGDAR